MIVHYCSIQSDCGHGWNELPSNMYFNVILSLPLSLSSLLNASPCSSLPPISIVVVIVIFTLVGRCVHEGIVRILILLDTNPFL